MTGVMPWLHAGAPLLHRPLLFPLLKSNFYLLFVEYYLFLLHHLTRSLRYLCVCFALCPYLILFHLALYIQNRVVHTPAFCCFALIFPCLSSQVSCCRSSCVLPCSFSLLYALSPTPFSFFLCHSNASCRSSFFFWILISFPSCSSFLL